MEKLNNFAVTKIVKTKENELSLKIQVNGLLKTFEIVFLSAGFVRLPEELEFLLRGNQVFVSKRFLQMLEDYKNGTKILMPFNILEKTSQQNREPVAA